MINPRAIRNEYPVMRSVMTEVVKNRDTGYHLTGAQRYAKALKGRPESKLQVGVADKAISLAPVRQVAPPKPGVNATDNQRRNYIQDVQSNERRRIIASANPLAPRAIPGRTPGLDNRAQDVMRGRQMSTLYTKNQRSRLQNLRPAIEPQLLHPHI